LKCAAISLAIASMFGAPAAAAAAIASS